MIKLFILSIGMFFNDTLPRKYAIEREMFNVYSIFNDSIESINSKPLPSYHIASITFINGRRKIIYLKPIYAFSDFFYGVPNSYSHFENRLVFEFESIPNQYNKDRHRDLLTQFKCCLINDLDSLNDYDSGNPNLHAPFKSELIPYYDFKNQVYRIEIEKNKIKTMQKSVIWPDRRFYESNYQFDKHGNLMYSDGFYHEWSLDRSTQFYFLFDIDEYFSQYGIKRGQKNISAFISIAKTGKVKSVKLIGNLISFSEQEIRNYETAIRKMPKWIPQTLKGKKVMYRVLLGL